MSALSLYEEDFFAWTQEQAKILKNKEFNRLDIEHLCEEVESMGKHEKRELKSRLIQLLMHLLKWKYQSEEQSKSWHRTIREQRRQIIMVLADNPSLKPLLQEYITDAYSYAIVDAHEETGVFLENFPKECEWTTDQVLDGEFYPN